MMFVLIVKMGICFTGDNVIKKTKMCISDYILLIRIFRKNDDA